MDVLVNKAYRTYDKVSRYTNFPYYYNVIDKKYIYGVTRPLAKDIPYIIHIVKQYDTYDSIALYYYNNPTYYWVICDFNNILDPYTIPEVGTELKIPSFSALQFEE